MIRPPFNRQGNKFLLLNEILPLIPEHNLYVELFVGSGAVFFNKTETNTILNDIDIEVTNRLELLKIAPTNISLYPNLDTIEKTKKFYMQPCQNIVDKIIKAKIKASCGFNGKPLYNGRIYVNKNAYCITKHLNYFKEKLENVKITNMDYFEIMMRNDDINTFFFIDPPYENTFDLMYSNVNFNYDLLAFRLKDIRGKFILTLNDSENIRELFEDFFVKEVVVNSWHGKKRNELIITNYEL